MHTPRLLLRSWAKTFSLRPAAIRAIRRKRGVRAIAGTCVRSVLADSGLFIGLFDAADKHHARCRDFVRAFRGKLLTTWPVLTEALAMLDFTGQQALLTWLDRGVKAKLVEIRCADPAALAAAIALTS